MRYRWGIALVAALAVVVTTHASPAGAASTKLRRPTLLWQSYPLVQHPAPDRFESQGVAIGKIPRLQVPSGGYGTSSRTMILFLLGSFAASVAGVFLLRSSLFDKPEAFVPSLPKPGQRQKSSEAASDQMDLLVALRPSSRRGRDPNETEDLPTTPPGSPLLEPEADPPRKKQRVLQEAPAKAARPTGVEVCHVFLRGRDRKYQLLAAPLAQGADRRAVAVSTFFSLRDEELPTEQGAAALRKLLAELERGGWRVSALGARWYDFTLERPRE